MKAQLGQVPLGREVRSAGGVVARVVRTSLSGVCVEVPRVKHIRPKDGRAPVTIQSRKRETWSAGTEVEVL